MAKRYYWADHPEFIKDDGHQKVNIELATSRKVNVDKFEKKKRKVGKFNFFNR
jgi:hypothetical protein